MKRLIDFCLLLLMVFWGSNAWADKTMTFGAKSPTSDCNLAKLDVPAGNSGSIEEGGITLQITAASKDNASWNAKPGSKHEQTIGLMTNAKITISSSSAETKITKIVFNFEKDINKGYFAESPTIGGTLDNSPSDVNAQGVNTQTWSLKEGANSVSLTNNSEHKAYITSIDITYKTGGLDNHTVQAYPYTWNFTDDKLWEKSESQFVSEIWKYNTADGADEWRNSPTVSTGYDVDLLRGLRFTGHVCADRRGNCVSLPRTATITIPSLHKGQKVKICYTGVDILPTTNLKVSQVRKDNIEIYKVPQDGDASLTVDPTNTTDWGALNWGVWISQISVLDAAPVLTMTTPANKETGVDPNLRSIKVTSEKALWAYNVDGTKTPTAQTIKATLTSDDENNNMEVTATLNAGETVLNFTLPQDKQLESATTYTLNIPENVIMETSGTGNKNCSFTFSTKGLNYLGAYDGNKKIEANPYTVSTLDNNRVEFAFEEKLEKTADFKVTVSDGTTVKSYTKDSKECVISADNKRLYVPVTLTAGKHYSIKITAGSLKDATAGSTLKNNQIVLNLISSMKGINLSMTTPYNQNEAPLTTRIILSAKDNDGNNKNIENNVEATLEGKSADGSQIHYIGTVTGIANGNKLVFTPKEGQQLRSNYTYTLTLKEHAKLQDVKDGTLPDVTFVFTTAKVIGNAPIVESTSPAAESTIKVEDVQPTTSKQIEIKFNEDIQLLDGALIFCRPMGGSESYKSIEYYSARSDIYNQIHVKGNKLWFEYSGQHLFYGMRYEVTIPTYAIVGNGGQPMEKNIKFYFETPKSTEASDSREKKDVYTWDFTNISASTFKEINESVTENKTYWGKRYTKNGNDLEYGSSNAGKSSFAQGQEIKAGASNTPLPELRGLLFNLVKNDKDRFQIVCKNKSEDKGNTYLSLKGNTHYVTIQSVPANAKVYIEHNGNEMFNLNTLGVDSIRTFTNSNNNSVSVYQLGNTTKDLTFCVQDCKLYRIAIVKDNKTIGSADKDYIKYATYSQSYPVDYSLNEKLTGTEVTAYSVSADYQSDATFVNFTALPNNQSADGEGVILKTSGKLGESHPIFTTDVNTIPKKPTSNALVGTGDKATEFATAKKEGYQNYILTNKYFHLDKDENQSGEVIDGNQQCFYKWVKGNAKSNFAYLQLKNPSSNATAAKTVIYLDWFGDTTGIHGMTAPSQVTSGKTYYTLDGRKVTSPTQKGIYIINGKKIIIK